MVLIGLANVALQGVALIAPSRSEYLTTALTRRGSQAAGGKLGAGGTRIRDHSRRSTTGAKVPVFDPWK